MITDNEQAILKEHNERFTYKKDGYKYLDNWVIYKGEEAFEGDCEDYSLALLWKLSKNSFWLFWWNILTMRGQIWYCKTASGSGHAMLKWRGAWVDNIFPQFRLDPIHRRFFPYLLPIVVLKLLISKLL